MFSRVSFNKKDINRKEGKIAIKRLNERGIFTSKMPFSKSHKPIRFTGS